jgi:hypothetical protein
MDPHQSGCGLVPLRPPLMGTEMGVGAHYIKSDQSHQSLKEEIS